MRRGVRRRHDLSRRQTCPTHSQLRTLLSDTLCPAPRSLRSLSRRKGDPPAYRNSRPLRPLPRLGATLDPVDFRTEWPTPLCPGSGEVLDRECGLGCFEWTVVAPRHAPVQCAPADAGRFVVRTLCWLPIRQALSAHNPVQLYLPNTSAHMIER